MNFDGFLVDRGILPTEYEELFNLIKKFNENHKVSSIKLKYCTKDSIQLTYSTKGFIEVIPFKTCRDSIRWINYINWADIN